MASGSAFASRPMPAVSANTQFPHLAERVVLMCASALFSGLTERECLEIASCARARQFARDELVFLQGQPVRQLVLIQTGTVKLTQSSPNGNEVLLWMEGQGDALAVNANAHCPNHTCSARAMENCHALTWEYSRLEKLMEDHPQIRNNINQMLFSRLNELEERFREVATEKVAKRLATTLYRLIKRIGRRQHTGVQVSLSREELAQMTGTTLFTISRILSRWSEEGFIEPRREAVIINDPERLLAIGSLEED